MKHKQITQQTIHDLLDTQKSQTIDAIRNYPPPIPACDAQFNYLLEKRDRLTVELNRLNQIDGTDTLTEFVTASVCISDEVKRQFQSQLEDSRIQT